MAGELRDVVRERDLRRRLSLIGLNVDRRVERVTAIDEGGVHVPAASLAAARKGGDEPIPAGGDAGQDELSGGVHLGRARRRRNGVAVLNRLKHDPDGSEIARGRQRPFEANTTFHGQAGRKRQQEAREIVAVDRELRGGPIDLADLRS